MNIKALEKLAESVWRGREPINAVMDELARYIYPDAAGFAGTLSASDEGRREIWDSTPEEAAGMLAAALGSLLTNPATSWFSLNLPGDQEAEGKSAEWLLDVTRRMLDAFAAPESRFYQEVDTFYMELAALAWAVLFIEYRDGHGLTFKAVPVSQCAIAENAEGMVDTLVRRFPMTAAQLAEEFGRDNLPDAVLQALESDPQKTFAITHLVMPRANLPKELQQDENAEEGQNGPDDKPFISVVLAGGAEKPLHSGGYAEFPFAVPRWNKRPGEVYGRGCGHAALPDIRVLNRVSLSQLDAAEKASNPPLLVPDDSTLDNKRINTFAGGITYWRPTGGEIKPLPIAADLTTMQIIREERKDSIRRLFLNDKLQLVGGPQMTATEIMARERKQGLALGPVMGRLQTEFLGPLITRVFSLLLKNGRLPEAPEELGGVNVRVRYVSPIARAQKAGDAEGFLNAMQFSAPLLQMQPTLMINFDADAIIRDTQKLFGYPETYLRDADEVTAMREEQAKAQQDAAQAQAAMQMAQLQAQAEPAGSEAGVI